MKRPFLLPFLALTLLSTTMLLWQASAAPGQTTVTYTPSSATFPNPERGFYHYIETRASNPTDYDLGLLETYRSSENITLLYCINYLDSFVNSPISQDFLDHLQDNFNTVRAAGLKCILRFAYTDNLPANEQPPFGDATQAQILAHIDQLEPVIQANADVIAVLQAGFIGVWGEWYYTDHFVDDPTTPWVISPAQHANRLEVLQRLLDMMPSVHQVQIRYPHGKQAMFDTSTPISAADAFSGSDLARVGHHNDCFLASDTDFGTYRDGSIATDKAYVAAETLYVPQGGETCNLNPPRSLCETAVSELSQLHWSYLNTDYHPDVLASWESGGCLGEIEQRLGYRFRLVEGQYSDIVRSGEPVSGQIIIHNDGFAAPYKPYRVELTFQHQQSGFSRTVFLTSEDPRLWLPGSDHTLTFSTTLNNAPLGDYRLSLRLRDVASSVPQGTIRFANEGVWDGVNGRNDLLHTVTLVDSSATDTPTPSISHTPTATATLTATPTQTAVPGTLPDLLITQASITLESTSCGASGGLGTRVWIANQGNANAAPFIVELNGSQQLAVESSLPAGQTTTIWFSSSAAQTT
ncbi:MAG: DUF4832 domain-containing protein, partial [Anaerolineales bacterium]|nr:DUF4832 domain-containing protein [Anaerolineales bacterium]